MYFRITLSAKTMINNTMSIFSLILSISIYLSFVYLMIDTDE